MNLPLSPSRATQASSPEVSRGEPRDPAPEQEGRGRGNHPVEEKGHDSGPNQGKESLRPKVRGGSSSPPLAISSLLCSGPQAHQPGHGRAGQRHPRHTSPGGDGPSDRSEEARVSPLPRLERPRGDPGNPHRHHAETAQLPAQAARSNYRWRRPRRRFAVPGVSPKDRPSRSQILRTAAVSCFRAEPKCVRQAWEGGAL
ncbi:hypothetical protein NDU88_006611 [Pleurodeles waltl]|uniref:Uncharacterized protein n=1 Tax=Pleurodeles waltl TaxID=8319 RepID=A0AAV7SQ53_PLEWA|nr:hypothetical protein NDU88_006611 [Pleurodeles waltl]